MLAGLNKTFSDALEQKTKVYMKSIVNNISTILMIGLVANYLALIVKDIKNQLPMYLEKRLSQFSK